MTDRPDPAFLARLDAAAAATETLLAALLSDRPEPGEVARPPRLLQAMRHAALAGGKRLRPFLVIESAALFSVPHEQAAMAGAALECVHCYSLVHDDLPAMDNDAMRRGRPAAHVAFDEATAILAGDSLLTLAFDILSRPQVHPEPAVRLALVAALARASGVGGMAGGQMLDLTAEGRFGESAPNERGVVELQRMKTGALLRFACIAGGLLGNAAAAEHKALSDYGDALGAAFQIADDLLDVEGDAAALGKATGKDAAVGKATLVGLLGVTAARTRLADLVDHAQTAVSVFGKRGYWLRQAARYVAERER